MDWRFGQAGASAGHSIEGPWAARWKLSLPLAAIRAQCLWCSVSVSGCRFLVLEPQNMNPGPGFGEKGGHWNQGKTFQSENVFEFYPRFVPALFPPVRGTASIWWLGQGLCIHGSVMCWSSVSRAGVCLLPWDQAWILISRSLENIDTLLAIEIQVLHNDEIQSEWKQLVHHTLFLQTNCILGHMSNGEEWGCKSCDRTTGKRSKVCNKQADHL